MVEGVHSVPEALQCGAVNGRWRQFILAANGIWEEGPLVNHGSGIRY